VGAQGGLVLEVGGLAVGAEEVDDVAVLLVHDLGPALDEGQVGGEHVGLHFGVVDVGEGHVLGDAELVEHPGHGLLGEDQLEVLRRVDRGGLLDVGALGELVEPAS
jgi:hypothetical protein